jgi:hypothetical protein
VLCLLRAPYEPTAADLRPVLEPPSQLLEVLNQYKKLRSPESTEEEECVENVFDALCTALVRRLLASCHLGST